MPLHEHDFFDSSSIMAKLGIKDDATVAQGIYIVSGGDAKPRFPWEYDKPERTLPVWTSLRQATLSVWR